MSSQKPLHEDPLMKDVIGAALGERCAEVLIAHARCGDEDASRVLDGAIKSLERGRGVDDLWLASALRGARPAALKLTKKAIKIVRQGGVQKHLEV